LVEKKFFRIKNFSLVCGEVLENIQIAYETYGLLNKDKSNAILVCHALTGDSHLALRYKPEDKKPGWWDQFVGENKSIDLKRYFVICSNVLGGCAGSTGPASINPETSRPYGLDFPFITIKDMIKAQSKLVEALGIERLFACVGGSMGGMQTLEWAITFPEKVQKFIIIATGLYQSPQNIALHEVGRMAIMNDNNWNYGKYSIQEAPVNGLSIARMIAHISYLSDQTMHQKFGRKIKGKEELNFELHNEFEVESYLNYQGYSFIRRFDANSYLYITRAVDYFDYSEDKLSKSLRKKSFARDSRFLVISFSSDWLYPPYQVREIVSSLQYHNLPVSYSQIESNYGHDAFLLESRTLGQIIKDFL